MLYWKKFTNHITISCISIAGLGMSWQARSEELGSSLNPGFVVGEVHYVASPSEFPGLQWDAQKIYILPSTPPTIRPVLGVITQGAGSSISHVQLLCRSLGIPNGEISTAEYQRLAGLHGKRVMYAAHANQKLRIKLAGDMGDVERQLYSSYQNENVITPVTLPPIDAQVRQLIGLEQLDHQHSGKIVGPKAARLGTLKRLLPNRVVEGFAIPFGAVRELFAQNGVLTMIADLAQMADDTLPQALADVRARIDRLAIPSAMASAIEDRAAQLIANNGGAGVFIRSDTNVEDLQGFSGAGLNRTVPNVISRSAILAAVRSVWASPWEERAYAWRRRYISNPEAILPSVLIMQSVDAFKAGVMVTRANLRFSFRSLEGLFISLAEGLGFKVVDGLERAEEWRVVPPSASEPVAQRMQLVAAGSAREKFVLNNENGGITSVPVEIDPNEEELLLSQEAEQLESIAQAVETDLGPVSHPWDFEFGIRRDHHVMLFQVRPLVENMNEKKQAILTELFRLLM